MNRPLARTLAIGAAALVAGYGIKLALYGTAVGTLRVVPLPCDTNDRCPIEVWVAGSGLIGCTATSKYNEITVARAYQPALVWTIRKEDAGSTVPYFFDTDGIRLHPGDANDPDQDLYDGKHDDAERARYRWMDRNKREKKVHFDVYVRRALPFGLSVACDARDPLIHNAGS